MERRLYRSTDNKIIGGVCGGLSDYFEIDPSLVRVVVVLLALAKGIGLLAYVVAWIIIPRQPFETEPVKTERRYSTWNKYLPGIILIAIGAILLIRANWYWWDWEELLPFVLVAAGLLLIFSKRKSVEEPETDALDAAPQQSNGQNGGTGS